MVQQARHLAVIALFAVLLASLPWIAHSTAGEMPLAGRALFEEIEIDPRDAVGQFALAAKYEHGEGVPQDFEIALKLYCKAAFQGHAGAAHSIGWIYLNGRGTDQNDDLAATWFKAAVEQGHAFSHNLLKALSNARTDAEGGCPADVAGPGNWQLESTGKIDRLVPEDIKLLAIRWAREFDLDPYLVLAVITVESAFEPDAVSPKDAQGLMQLIPATAARFGVSDAFDASENVRGGTQYLRWLVDHFDGNLKLALAGYNSGEATVASYGGVPPYPETQWYIRKIYDLYAHPDLEPEQKPAKEASFSGQELATKLAVTDYLASR